MKTNLMYVNGVDYDYERTNCHCNEDYCRCTTICSTEINAINVTNVMNRIFDKMVHSKDSDILKYCFDRICYNFEIYNKSLYEVEVCGGYYGEEIEGVYFLNEDKVVEQVDIILSLKTDYQKIIHCLNLEYGYLLEEIKNKSLAKIVCVDKSLILIPQKEHYVKLNQDAIKNYKESTLPLCVCTKQEEHYRLVDGYHRVFANFDLQTIPIILIE